MAAPSREKKLVKGRTTASASVRGARTSAGSRASSTAIGPTTSSKSAITW